MRFFVPGSDDPETTLEALRQFALAGASARRIYSITFGHDSDEGQATVGRLVRIRRHIPKSSRRWKQYGENLEAPTYDSATVLAIFEGDPYLVVTDGGPISERPSALVNPFLVGSREIIASEDFEVESPAD